MRLCTPCGARRPGVRGRGRRRSPPPAPLAVAAASDLQSVLPALAARFERETGRRVTLTFGSSGNFFSQIQNGAPFDLFFSADVDYPRRLEAAGLTEPGTLAPVRASDGSCCDASTTSSARSRARPRGPDRRARAAYRHREPRTRAVRPRGRGRAHARAALRPGPRPSSCSARTSRRPRSSCSRATPRPGCSRCRSRWRRPFAIERHVRRRAGVLLSADRTGRRGDQGVEPQGCRAPVPGVSRPARDRADPEGRRVSSAAAGAARPLIAWTGPPIALSVRLAALVSVLLLIIALPIALLADVPPQALDVSRRGRRRAAARAAADRARILRPARDRIAQPGRPAVDGVDRARPRVHLRGAGARVDPLQPAVRGPADQRRVRAHRSSAARGVGDARRVAVADVRPHHAAARRSRAFSPARSSASPTRSASSASC